MEENKNNQEEVKQEKSQEEMVKEAVEEAKKTASAKEEPGDGEIPVEDGDKEDKAGAEGQEEPEEEASPEEGKTEGKKLFGRKKKDKKDEKIEELTDKLTRQMAEFDNFRKRTEREKSQMYEVGAKDIIEKILPIVDSFERGLDAVKEEEREHPFMQGMDKVYKQMMTTLKEIGVTPIEAVGKEFDPAFHNAVMHVEDEAFGENQIAEVFQQGFQIGDKVIRHAMVKVAN